jgi:diguanylate cyclase (GGDEF)-like protein
MVDASHAFAKNLLVILSERVRSHNQVIADSFGELQKIQRHATTDALTGHGNRHSMQAVFPRKIRRCLRAGDAVSMIMIDVDNLKIFNDQFGHLAGDRALKAVADILARTFRPCDIIVRYGGDEFAVLLPNVDRAGAVEIAERVRSAVSGDDSTEEDSLVQAPIRISMGVADIRESGDLDTLIRAADAALYRAKRSGRNAVAD